MSRKPVTAEYRWRAVRSGEGGPRSKGQHDGEARLRLPTAATAAAGGKAVPDARADNQSALDLPTSFIAIEDTPIEQASATATDSERLTSRSGHMSQHRTNNDGAQETDREAQHGVRQARRGHRPHLPVLQGNERVFIHCEGL